jgi:NADPH:quinone reductase-like Zn-dependent oxidoreductase
MIVKPMKAVVVHETGGPGVLKIEEADPPQPDEGEVLARVHAASVNPVDWKTRSGMREVPLPTILGYDFSGVVEESRADGFEAGDEVFGWASSGGYAELATASGESIARKPAGITHEQAAAIPVAGATAQHGLFDKGGLESGQTALVAGAAGGVGHLGVQLARLAGARVTGTGSARNRDFVLGLGAEEYVDYTEQDVGEAVADVDVALDTVGGDVTGSLVPTLREGGVLVTIANAPPEEDAKKRGARAELLVSWPDPETIARIAELAVAGDLQIEIAEAIPLDEVQRAHELSETGHVRGKLVLSIGG